MGYHLPDFELKDEWTELSTIPQYAEIAGKLITVQAKYVSEANVFIGGDEAPEGKQGSLLKTLAAISSTADKWWVRGYGHISILVEE